MSTNVALLVTIGFIVIVLAARIIWMSREQRVRPVSMWIAPVIFAGLAAALVIFNGFTSLADIGLMVVALLVGGAIGWYQGTHTTVRVESSSGSMFVKTSPIGAVIFVAVLALRFGIRYVTGGLQSTPAPGGGAALSAPHGVANTISLLLLVLAVGMVAGLRVYLQRAYARTVSV